jgi:hypothetical protein
MTAVITSFMTADQFPVSKPERNCAYTLIRTKSDHGKRNTHYNSGLVPSTIQDISYGQDVHRRIGAAISLAVIYFGIGGLMALTKSKKHYVGLTWATGDAKGGFAMNVTRTTIAACSPD